MKYLTIEEIHVEETKMLKKFIEFCEKNNLTYYICGGTLLGAIRHKGFIPWDDDIDVMMPRKEFEKLEKILNKKRISENLEFISYDNGNMNYPFGKIMNTNIKIANSCLKDSLEPFLWIDIFPMDGIPESNKKARKLYKKVIMYRKILLILYAEDNYVNNFSKSKVKKLIKKVIRFFVDENKRKKLAQKLNDISKKYNYDESKYVGGVVWGYGTQEKMLKDDIHDYKVNFEGLEVNTISCYEKYLTNLYGDYMKLPPIEKRITHEIKVYRIGD